MDPGTISALSALAGSFIGALASVGTTWLTQNHQDLVERMKQEGAHRERIFGEFIDQASKTYADGVVREGLDDPAKLVPMYATINKLRLFATPDTIAAAEAVLEGIVETYESPSPAPQARRQLAAHDILRTFADSCRAELARLR
ncbi:hypothetical protein FJ546_10050 [Mesorhizobium sp. B2-4-19]|nr:hypothetical protein FJ546_10050 [Mesorhizobium sp. B2-4-19]